MFKLITLALMFLMSYGLMAQNQKQFRISINPISQYTNDTLITLKDFQMYKTRIEESKSKRISLDSISNNDSTALWGPMRFFYDNLGRDTCEIFYQKDKAWRPWHLSTKNTLEYDKKNRITCYSSYNYHRGAFKWQLSEKISVEYATDDLSIKEYHIWNNTYNNTLDTLFLTYYQLDSNHNLILEIDTSFFNNTREPLNKTVYHYDSLGRFTSTVISYWNSDSSQWKFNFKISVSYYKANLLDESHFYFWNDSLAYWVPLNKSKGFYNSQDKIIKVNTYYMDTTLIVQDSFTYDANGFPYEMIVKRIDTTHQLNLKEYHKRINNQYGDPDYYYMYWWDSKLNNWLPAVKIHSVFDANYDREYALLPFHPIYNIDYNKIILSENFYGYDTTLNQWDNNAYTNTYYYSLREVLHISKSAWNKGIKVYPNPSTSEVNIALPDDVRQAEIEIFNTDGMLVKKQRLESNRRLSVEDLDAGIYLLRIISGNRIFSAKVIINP